MPAERKLPDSAELLSLRNQGWTYEEIADEYKVTPGAVYLQLRNAHATATHLDHKKLIPWTLAPEHRMARPAEMLRLLGRERAGQKIEPPAKKAMLDKWLKTLADQKVVVCYDPEKPPNEASRTGGFYYVPREPSDGDSIIRE